jgi:hypothetical protein
MTTERDVRRSNGEHAGLPGDKACYYPQAEADHGDFTIVVLPRDEAGAPYTRETADRAAVACEAVLRSMLICMEQARQDDTPVCGAETTEAQDVDTMFWYGEATRLKQRVAELEGACS